MTAEQPTHNCPALGEGTKLMLAFENDKVLGWMCPICRFEIPKQAKPTHPASQSEGEE